VSIRKDRLRNNLQHVRRRIAQAARLAGRAPEAVTLIVVTKTVGPQTARALVAMDEPDLGENRVPDLPNKAKALADLPVRWHMIGHLQRNKVRKVLPVAHLIHSVDSVRLARQIDRVAGELGTTAKVLLEVNTGGEEAKHGFAPDGLDEQLTPLAELTHLRVEGLMTMAPFVTDPESARPCFVRLRQLIEHLQPLQGPNMDLRELSMGMTNDFEVAVQEGATIVRVGTAIVGDVEEDG